jgi:hypothetical protein
MGQVSDEIFVWKQLEPLFAEDFSDRNRPEGFGIKEHRKKA